MNRQELRRRVAGRLSLPETGTPRLTEPMQNANIDEALRKVATAKRWPWLQTTAPMQWLTGVAGDVVPTDMLHPHILTIVVSGTSREARWVDLRLFLQPERSGHVWTMIGRTLTLAPTPTTTVNGTLYYYRTEPLMPEGYQDAIIHYASHLGAMNLQNQQLAADQLSLYDRFVAQMDDGSTGAPSGRKVRTQEEIRSDFASWV